jgi:hypothetical protein
VPTKANFSDAITQWTEQCGCNQCTLIEGLTPAKKTTAISLRTNTASDSYIEHVRAVDRILDDTICKSKIMGNSAWSEIHREQFMEATRTNLEDLASTRAFTIGPATHHDYSQTHVGDHAPLGFPDSLLRLLDFDPNDRDE